jgi:adenosylcobyric acid synthase
MKLVPGTSTGAGRRARALMVLGTASHVGKSVLAAALCRILKQDGLDVAPFKAQNMALNSAATPEGLEIGRAQAMQAEAAGVAPSVDMNPILLKPQSDSTAQLVVLGRVRGAVSAAAYHRRRVLQLFGVVEKSYERLAARHDVVVLEGAGSPAEVNLAASDIVNMRMARHAGAACILVADIDRGGVFASLVGTMALLAPADRRRVRGFVVNRFRGDPALFDPGIAFLEKRLRRPCLGVVPYLPDLGLDEEDGVALDAARDTSARWPRETGPRRRLRVAVVALPRISNFTDFDALAAEPSVMLAFVRRPADLAAADVVILPGTKQTLADLAWLRSTGLARAIGARASRRLPVVGICGGMQMLGLTVADPHGMEGGGRRRGLGLLQVHTVLERRKVTVRARARLPAARLFGRPVAEQGLQGYEIHLGATVYDAGARPLLRVRREGSAAPHDDGAVSPDGYTIGTYMHGLFDDDRFRHALVRALRRGAGLSGPARPTPFTADRDARFDRLAAHVRAALDVALIRSWLR